MGDIHWGTTSGEPEMDVVVTGSAAGVTGTADEIRKVHMSRRSTLFSNSYI